jgi:hypothetical protein
LEFKPFTMDFTPLGISPEQAEAEVRQAWESSYNPAANASAIEWLEKKSFADQIIHLLGRLAFRGIYFPQMKRREWVRLLFENRAPILHLIFQALKMRFSSRAKSSSSDRDVSADPTPPLNAIDARLGQAPPSA